MVKSALSAGMYKVELVTQYSSGHSALQEPRIAVFEHVLTVL